MTALFPTSRVLQSSPRGQCSKCAKILDTILISHPNGRIWHLVTWNKTLEMWVEHTCKDPDLRTQPKRMKRKAAA